MPKIVVFGDIRLIYLYLRVDNSREMTFSGKSPRFLDVPAGVHRVYAQDGPKGPLAVSREIKTRAPSLPGPQP